MTRAIMPGHYLIQAVERQIDSMVCNAILREIICPYFLAPVARADHSLSPRVPLSPFFPLEMFVYPASEYPPGLGAVFMLTLFVLHTNGNSRWDMLKFNCAAELINTLSAGPA